MNLMTYGITALFRGARKGDVPLVLFGSVLAVWGWRRNRPKKKRKVAKRIKLSAGKSVGLRVTAKGAPPKEFVVNG
jgi:hypothetical protein